MKKDSAKYTGGHGKPSGSEKPRNYDPKSSTLGRGGKTIGAGRMYKPEPDKKR